MTPQNTASARERMSSPLTWHYIGLAVLGLIVLVLAIRLGLDW